VVAANNGQPQTPQQKQQRCKKAMAAAKQASNKLEEATTPANGSKLRVFSLGM